MTYGLFVLTARESDKDNGCIVNTCFQVALEPTRLVISVEKHNLTRQMIERTGAFNISVLTEDTPFEVVRHFGMQSGADVDKFASYDKVARSENGILYLTEPTNAMLSCKVLEKRDLGSHMLFIAEVERARVLSSKSPCTYAHYHKAIKPKF